MHDVLCSSLIDDDLFTVSVVCDCVRFAEVREDERREAEARVSSAVEMNVKVKGVSCSVISRSDAILAAGGVLPESR